MTYNQILDEIKDAILALLIKLGVFIVPAMPASFLGYAVYSNYESPDIGFWFALVTAVAFVVIGIVISALALKTIDAWQGKLVRGWKAAVMGLMIPATAIVGAVVIYFSDGAFSPIIKGLGIAGEFLAMFVYIALAIDSSIDYAKVERSRLKAERKAERAERSLNVQPEHAEQKSEHLNAQPEQEMNTRELVYEHLNKLAEQGLNTSDRMIAGSLDISVGSANKYHREWRDVQKNKNGNSTN